MVACNHMKNFKNIIIVTYNYKGEYVIMSNNVNQAVAKRINELLKKKNMTRYKLAMNSGVTHSTLKNIINDTINDNLLSTIILIAGGFDMTISEFLDSPLFSEDNLHIQKSK